MKKNIDKIDFTKIKVYCSSKDTIKKIKESNRLGDNIYTYPYKGLVSNI